MAAKNPNRFARVWDAKWGSGLPESPPRRKVKGKAANHMLDVAKKCDEAVLNFEALCAHERELRDDPKRAWMHQPEKLREWEGKVKQAKQLADAYRRAAGK